ncbi:putative protein phosphatase 2C 78 [Dorcoceras hygrometricum]|uniref:Uncharacterized protein n=1 Tax=Dorcoceras hygrometricum TaxID=472368 RepID=A0A2Z7CAQ0_9LAMI|nr:putative protein phosphatase 2C 78 [Dorcoceras hygrometricum]
MYNFVQYSLFAGLSTDDIRSFVSTLALDRTVLRGVQIVQSSISVAPSVQMMIDQSPFSSSTSDDSSMHFDDNDTADTSNSLPPAATDVMESLAKLRASVDQVQPRKEDIRTFDEQDRVHRALRKDMHDQKNLLSLDLKSTHQKLSAQIAAAAFDTVDVRKEVKEINAKVTTWMGRLLKFEGESGSSRPQPPPDDQTDPAEEVVAVALGKEVAEVEVREEAIGVDLPREDLTVVVVDRSEDHFKIG